MNFQRFWVQNPLLNRRSCTKSIEPMLTPTPLLCSFTLLAYSLSLGHCCSRLSAEVVVFFSQLRLALLRVGCSQTWANPLTFNRKLLIDFFFNLKILFLLFLFSQKPLNLFSISHFLYFQKKKYKILRTL